MAKKIGAKFRNFTPQNTTNMASVDEQLLHESRPKIAEVSSAPSDDIAQ